MAMTHYLYLHGFASSPQSTKAETLRQHFQDQGLTLQIPDLNQGDFTHLTLSRQIQQAKTIMLPVLQAAPKEKWVLIGSSFGGLTSAWLAEQPDLQAAIAALVLLAPAFEFLTQWLPRLGAEQLQQWQATGTLAVYHYGAQRSLPLDYGFLTDAQTYDETQLQQPIPTLILHGRQDEVISIDASHHYAATRPWVKLIELESDHALADVQSEIWQAVQQFLAI